MALLYFGRSPIRRKISGVAKEIDLPSGILNFDADLWFEVNPDNTITLKSPKVEMGQGIFTGFAMLAAEELDMALDKIKVVHATTLAGAMDLHPMTLITLAYMMKGNYLGPTELLESVSKELDQLSFS